MDGKTGERDMGRVVSFDWALKRLLRSKANFDVLEGFLSELLGRDVTVLELLESEGNQEREDDEIGHLELKVRLGEDEIVYVEVQASRFVFHFHRMLFGVSKVIAERASLGADHERMPRVISVNVFFGGLGHGGDYLYHGRTVFESMHGGSPLRPRYGPRRSHRRRELHSLFPEYWIIDLRHFDEILRPPLDEWIHFLKWGRTRGEIKARGLEKAERIFDVLAMTKGERIRYDIYDAATRKRASEMETQWIEGYEEGLRLAAIESGRLEERRALARKLLALHDAAMVAELTGLALAEIEELDRG